MVECFTMFSSSVEETRWNACNECGSSRGAIGSQKTSFGALILMRICQLKHKIAYINNYIIFSMYVGRRLLLFFFQNETLYPYRDWNTCEENTAVM